MHWIFFVLIVINSCEKELNRNYYRFIVRPLNLLVFLWKDRAPGMYKPQVPENIDVMFITDLVKSGLIFKLSTNVLSHADTIENGIEKTL